jgi:hypothetical protein
MENIFSLIALRAQEKEIYSGWMRNLLRRLGPNDESIYVVDAWANSVRKFIKND